MFYLTFAGSWHDNSGVDVFVESVGVCNWQNTDISTVPFATEPQAIAALEQRKAASIAAGATIEETGDGGYHATFPGQTYGNMKGSA